MTPRQRRFVDEYLIDLNATAAALRAGYARSTAEDQSYRLLKQPEIAAAIGAAQKERAERLRLTQDYVLGNLIELAERCMQKVPVMVRRGGVQVHSTDEAGHHMWTFNATGATRALELIGKHLGMFVDQHQGDHVHYAVSAEPDPQTVDEWQRRYKTLQ